MKPTLVMESVSLFDMMADAGIDPYIPGASSNSGGTRDTGSAMERGVADAVTERAVDSDDADQWWDGMLGIKKRPLPGASRANADDDSDDDWYRDTGGMMNLSQAAAARSATSSQLSQSQSPAVAVPADEDVTTPSLTPSSAIAVPADANVTLPTPSPTPSSAIAVPAAPCQRLPARADALPLPSPTPTPILFPISITDALADSPSGHVDAINEIRDISIFDLSYLMPYSMDYDSAFRQACAAISSVRTRFTIPVFKIGICANPHYRYFNDLYGYHFWGYTVFAPLWQATSPKCGRLETALIKHFDRILSIQNKPFSGGENLPRSPVCFVYVVACEAGPVGATFRSRGPQTGAPQRRGKVQYN